MRYPGAQWKPINVNYQMGGCAPRYLVLHIMQGTLTGTDSWFRNPAAQVSAHFGVGKDGTLIQWVDTGDTAWHAANANSVAIGVEHEGNAGDSLSPAQIAADAKLYAWAHEHHAIPMALTSDPVHGSGLAWHGMGGVSWGDHPDCPGSPIVAERAAILAAAKVIVTPPKPPPAPAPEEDMTIVTVEAASVPRGTPWPGRFNMVPDAAAPLGMTLRHIPDDAHLAALRAAGVMDAAKPLSYANYLLLSGK
jgi:N-acetylmuramoyl-L-alanine amidase-like protein